MENEEFDLRVRALLGNVQGATEEGEHLSVEHVTEIRRRVDGLLSEALADAHERLLVGARGERALEEGEVKRRGLGKEYFDVR